MEKENHLLIPCTCGAHHFLDITWFEGKDWGEEIFITITIWAKGLLERIRGALEVLRGGRYAGCEEIVLSKKGARKMAKFLERYFRDINPT